MTENPHPLDPATAAEYLAGREIMAAAGLLAEPVRFAYYGLEEPAKDAVLASASNSGPVDRRLRAFLLNLKNGESTDVVVSLTKGGVVSARTVDTAAEGQLPIIDSEYHLVEEIMAADPDWRAALARRGLTDMSKIRIAPITAGAYRAPA
jgi:primary-amine oxidase